MFNFFKYFFQKRALKKAIELAGKHAVHSQTDEISSLTSMFTCEYKDGSGCSIMYQTHTGQIVDLIYIPRRNDNAYGANRP